MYIGLQQYGSILEKLGRVEQGVIRVFENERPKAKRKVGPNTPCLGLFLLSRIVSLHISPNVFLIL